MSFAILLVTAPAVASGQVLDLLGTGGWSDLDPNNSGRATTEFWDNFSADQTAGNADCNVGFFAVGTMSPGCANVSAGTLANQGGFAGGEFFGQGNLPAPFLFSGEHTYNLTLVGAVSGKTSQVGWFTRTSDGNGGWVYDFNPINPFGAKVINSTYTINAGSDWGFYFTNTFNSQGGGCVNSTYHCSDASGGWLVVPYQQFVVMRSGETSPGGFHQYLVGVEDNKLETSENGSFSFNYYDSDYNDYLIAISIHETVAPEPATMALLATGLVGMAGASYWRRRRQRS